MRTLTIALERLDRHAPFFMGTVAAPLGIEFKALEVGVGFDPGRRDGIEPGSVATARGQHLLGRIVNLDDAMCDILPITDRNADTIEVITTGEGAGLRFDLTPEDNGTLKGPGRYVTEGLEQTPRTAQVGQQVALADENWRGNEGLIVGEIIEVEASPEMPLRQVITVRPIIDTRRVSSVVIRVPGAGS